jgi:hypothetical protein
LSLLWLRTKLQEPVEYHKETMKNTRVPWLLVIKFYWKRLAVMSAVWFMYNVKLQYAVWPRKHADPPNSFLPTHLPYIRAPSSASSLVIRLHSGRSLLGIQSSTYFTCREPFWARVSAHGVATG